MEKEYSILAYYHICFVDDPHGWVKDHKKFFKTRDVKGRLYISEEGINGQMSGEKSDCEAYIEWVQSKPGFENIQMKIQPHHENIFFKMTVKYRKQLVAFDEPVDLKKAGRHMSPQEWKRHLEGESEDYLLIDVRNDYETKIGHFKGAELPNCQSFREFKEYTQKELIENRRLSKDQKILMYCTGGIRCEYYSAYMKENGFENIHQLDGGIINYAHQEGDQHWDGKLFVFDDRLIAKLGQEDKCISKCHHCDQAVDTYYNCANMDCNFLFICCRSCFSQYSGCCSSQCTTAERLRPTSHFSNKPFRKWYYYHSESELNN